MTKKEEENIQRWIKDVLKNVFNTLEMLLNSLAVISQLLNQPKWTSTTTTTN